MRESFTYGSVGGAPGNRCFYPELGQQKAPLLRCSTRRLSENALLPKLFRIVKK